MKKKLIILMVFTVMLFSSIMMVNAADCSSYKKQDKCENAGCRWDTLTSRRGKCVVKSTSSGSSKTDDSKHASCGNINGIPKKVPKLTSFIITLLQVATAVILVIMGTIDLFKGLASSKDDEIKKGQQSFVKRLITAALVFLVILIVKLVIGAVADSSSSNIVSCMDCFLSYDCN